MSNTPKTKSELREALKLEQKRRYRLNLIKDGVAAIIAEQNIDAVPEPAPAPAPAAPAAAPAAPTAEQQPQATVDSIIEKLNVIRGGNSFSEPEVYGGLTKWWKTLDPNAQALLDDQLNQIGIISSVAEPEEESPQAAGSAADVQASAPPAPAPAAPAPAAPAAPAAPVSSGNLPVTPV